MIIEFEYSGAGGHTITIQWYRDDGVIVEDGDHDGVIISGATTTQLEILNGNSEWSGDYYAIVTDVTSDCEVETDPVEVEFPDLCVLEITTQPESQEITEGDTLTLTVVASGEVGSLQYQWYRDGVALFDGPSGGSFISGVNTDTLEITTLEAALAGDYTVVVTDDGLPDCSVTSDEAVVTVEPPAATNTISFAFFMQMLTQPNPASADILSDYDFELWDDPSGTMQARIHLAMVTVGGGSDEYVFGLTVSQGGDSNTIITSSVPFPLRTWHHVAVVYDGNTGFASLYVDAVLVGTTSGTPVTFASQPYGYLNLTGASHSVIDYLDSYVYMQDLTGVWVGHALTETELTALYNGGAGFNGPWTTVTEPTAWWDFDDAGRIDATENFVDAIQSIELDPQGSIAQLEGLINFGVIKTGFNRTMETEVIADFAYTA